MKPFLLLVMAFLGVVSFMNGKLSLRGLFAAAAETIN